MSEAPPPVFSKESFLAQLEPTQKEELESRMSREEIAAGTVLFHFGDTGTKMYIVESGRIGLTVADATGDPIELGEIEPGHAFGELSLFDPGIRSATATALEDCSLLVLEHHELMQFLHAHPGVAVNLLGVMARRLRRTDELLMGRVTRNLNTKFETNLSGVQRVASWIADFSGSIPFLVLNALFFFVWIVLNVDLVRGVESFDPYPFGFLTMSVSLEAIFLSIFVLLAQNVQSAKERMRADVEYEINLKAELEVAELHRLIHRLEGELSRRLTSLERMMLGHLEGRAGQGGAR